MKNLLVIAILTLLAIACDMTGPEGLQGPPGVTDTLYVFTSDTVYVVNEDGREIVWLMPVDIIGEMDGIRYFDIDYGEFKQRRASPILAQMYWSDERWQWLEWAATTCEDQTNVYYRKLGVAETGRFRMAYFYWDRLE